MELEFDEEIDTILRKAGGTSARPAAGDHLDADAIAAFAEGALPQSIRTQYTSHLADCGRCTGILAQTARSMPAEEARPAGIVAPVEAAEPWYKGLFATRNLSLAMGSLAVLFAVMIGYMAFRTGADKNSVVTQVTAPANPIEQPFPQSEASDTTSASTATSSSMSSVASNTATMTSNSATAAAPAANIGAGAATGSALKEESLSARSVQDLPVTASNRSDLMLGGTGTARQPVDAAKPMSAAPPPPPAPLARSTDAERSADAVTTAETAASAEAKALRDSRARSISPPAAKLSPSASGPLQNQQNQQMNSRNFEMPVTRTAGGKTFNNRERVWYDSAYTGQPTTNVRRGSDEFQKLDSGLRSVANTIGGTVVVVWKGKAYRIQ